MPDYFVDRLNGNDSNNGLSVATAWQTLGKAVSSTGVASVAVANNIYIAQGTYEFFTTNFSGTPTAYQSLIGDTNGAIFGRRGRVIVSPWGPTGDPNTSVAQTGISVRGTHNFVRFQNLTIFGGSAVNRYAVQTFNGWSQNVEFIGCALIGGQSASAFLAHHANLNAYSTARNWLFDRCVFMSAGAGIAIGTFFNSTAHFDIGLTARNCLFVVGNQGIRKDAPLGGLGVFTASGGLAVNCTFVANREAISVASGNSATFPFRLINNCITLSQNVGVNSGAAGLITGNRNRIVQNTTNSANYTGVNDITAGIVGLDGLVSFLQREGNLDFFMPSEAGVLTGQGVTTGETPSVDILGRTRPGSIAIGAFEGISIGSGPLVGGKLIQ